MSCLAQDLPTMPDFRGRKHHRLPSVFMRSYRNTSCEYLADEKGDAHSQLITNELCGSLCSYMRNNTSDLFDGTHTTLYNDQSFTLFEDHILIHSPQFPSMKIKRILYRNILDVSICEELAISWYSIKSWNFTMNGVRRSPTIVLTIRNKYRKVELSVRDPTAYSLLERLVYEANNTPLTID
ncbi:hypothetical protein K7432_007438 [Basidiobolus ranarum]|uniref:Uncharacterized protein n=1 Tax=Basidiobolus ranarum TaxID=34480 RepID=A0ABR2WTI5_9FUNG